jgi:hypothetical protein
MKMSQEAEWKWWASSNEEDYTVGPCDSKQQAIAEAVSNELGYNFSRKDKHVMTFHVVEARKAEGRLSEMFDGYDWLLDLDENKLADEYNEWNDSGPCEHIDATTVTAVVRNALREWEDREGVRLKLYRFADCRNGEWVTREFQIEEAS